MDLSQYTQYSKYILGSLTIVIVSVFVYMYFFKTSTSAPEPQLRPGCLGESCWCKKGAPCQGLIDLLRKEVEEDKEIYFCPHCDKSVFTLHGGNPLSFIEHKCGCGHWGWLHLL